LEKRLEQQEQYNEKQKPKTAMMRKRGEMKHSQMYVAMYSQDAGKKM